MRYQFQSKFSRGRYFKARMLTDTIKILISINLIIFLLQTLSQQRDILFHLFGIVPGNTFSKFMIWQPVTYLFLHANFGHILSNMFFLWMFGSEIETLWGGKEFRKYYFITGVGSGLVWLLFNFGKPAVVLVGASGAIYGILVAYGILFSNRKVYLFPLLVPIKAKWLVLFLGIFGCFFSAPNVSLVTHMAGIAIGFMYIKFNLRWSVVRTFLTREKDNLIHTVKTRRRGKIEELRSEVDRLLDKINENGYDELTQSEMSFLYEASKKLSKEEEKD